MSNIKLRLQIGVYRKTRLQLDEIYDEENPFG
jgi:hypothetical protein